MTIGSAIGQFDQLVHNQIQTPVKVVWLSALDGLIHREVLATHLGAGPEVFSGYDSSADPETELLVPYPYEEIYRWYLELKVWEVLGEMGRYNNAAQKYNTALLSFQDYVNRTYPVKQVTSLKLV